MYHLHAINPLILNEKASLHLQVCKFINQDIFLDINNSRTLLALYAYSRPDLLSSHEPTFDETLMTAALEQLRPGSDDEAAALLSNGSMVCVQ